MEAIRRHPDLDAEQAYFDLAHACLDTARERAMLATSSFRSSRGGTQQARFEREAMLNAALARLTTLDIGDRSLVFGRIEQAAGSERFYIGRVGLWDAQHDPIVVDWRAPIAEPFYRATGPAPLGLEHRRHFASRGSTLLGIEDEFFGENAAIGLDISDSDTGRGAGAATSGGAATGAGAATSGGTAASGGAATGAADQRTFGPSSALMVALEAARTGRLGDVVATIQGEQDSVIRSEFPGVLVVDGGPGTGKTVVALHRAAYLLYTHRFPLESQGVLVIGPNRLFLSYIEQVLPSLGEAGVEQAVLADLLSPPVRVAGLDDEAAGRIKGDPRMAGVLRRALRDRRRPLRSDLSVAMGLQRLTLTVEQSARIINDTDRRARKHNSGRKFLEDAFYATLAGNARLRTDPTDVRASLSEHVAVREALEWMWPVLTPAQLLQDLYGSEALLRSAAAGRINESEIGLLHRPRRGRASQVTWTAQDVPLLDEVRALLGYRPRHREVDAVLTYGHIVVDEAQDLSPMALRMIARRSLNGSMTIVGDIAQATGPWAHDNWDSVLVGLPRKRPPRRVRLTLGYRIGASAMQFANRVLPHIGTTSEPPRTVRTSDDEPRIVSCPGCDSTERALAETLERVIEEERASVGEGNVAVVVPDSLHEPLRAELAQRLVVIGDVGRSGLREQVTLVPVRLVKGLEVDSVVVVEPARILSEECQGVRSLYVAVTRATRRVTVVHAETLPEMLAQPDDRQRL